MKYKILLLIFLLSFNIVLAQEIDLFQDEYVAGDTIQFYVLDTSITASQISLTFNNTEIITISPLIIEFRDNQNLVYFDSDTTLLPGPYQLFAKDLETNFTITEGTEALKIKPGLVILNKKWVEFGIEIENKGEATLLHITSSEPNVQPRKSVLGLGYKEKVSIYSDYKYNNFSTDSFITFTTNTRTYIVPIIHPEQIVEVTTEETNITEEIIEVIKDEPIEEIIALNFLSESSDIELTPTSSYNEYIEVENLLDTSITGLTYTLTGDLEDIITLNVTDIDLEAGQTYKQYIMINQEENAREGTYEGELVLSNEEYSISIPITVTIAEAVEEVIEDTEETNTQTVILLDEPTGSSSSSSGTVIVGTILIIVLLGLFFLIWSQVKRSDKKQFKKYIDETKKK
ncbi:MAG: hypothetical protein Q8Q35_01475 [Nanoarchaeota archaeon]|nr:hypothetical protein [Nanoarchaeota archaeon]